MRQITSTAPFSNGNFVEEVFLYFRKRTDQAKFGLIPDRRGSGCELREDLELPSGVRGPMDF
jgi:hypothetical protein